MKIDQRDILVVLSQEGRRALRDAAIELPASPTILFQAQEEDEHGLWIRIAREDGDHLVLIRWDYILALDLTIGEIREEGPIN